MSQDDDDGSERERAGLTSQVSGADVTWRAVTWGHVTVSPLRRYFRPKVVSGVDCTDCTVMCTMCTSVQTTRCRPRVSGFVDVTPIESIREEIKQVRQSNVIILGGRGFLVNGPN